MIDPNLTALEFIPVILSVIALVMTALAFPRIRRRSEQVSSLIIMFSCILLFIGQTDIWAAHVTHDSLVTTWFFDKVWLIFDTIIMIAIIISAYPRNNRDENK